LETFFIYFLSVYIIEDVGANKKLLM